MYVLQGSNPVEKKLWRLMTKKLTFLGDMSANAFSPPPTHAN